MYIYMYIYIYIFTVNVMQQSLFVIKKRNKTYIKNNILIRVKLR